MARESVRVMIEPEPGGEVCGVTKKRAGNGRVILYRGLLIRLLRFAAVNRSLRELTEFRST